LARAGGQVDPRNARLAAADGLPAELVGGAHQAPFAVAIAYGVGDWAACGCSAPPYTFSLVRSFCRAREFFGSIPNTAFSITRSGCSASSFSAGVWDSWPMYPVCLK